MEEKVRRIMSSVFLVDIEKIDENASPETLPKWDSLGHLNLITSIEEEFGITLDDEQISEMLNYKLVLEVIRECLKASS